MIGTASTAPTAPFASRESLNRKARRECPVLRTLSASVWTACSFWVFGSLGFIAFAPEGVLVVVRHGASWVCRIRLARVDRPLRCQPRNDVGDLLVRQWLRGIGAPIRHALVRLPGNRNTAQRLIADQRKIGPVDDGADPALPAPGIARDSFATRPMASSTERAEGLLTPHYLPRHVPCVIRNARPCNR